MNPTEPQMGLQSMPKGEVGKPITAGEFDVARLMEFAIKTGGEQAVAIVERLMPIRRELEAERAKKAFDESMAAFQLECPVIQKEKLVKADSGASYSYAPMEAIEIQIRPFTQKHGFSHTFDTDTASEVGWVIAKCIVTHREGHSRISTAKFPLGTRTKIMSDTQVYASALTFANRRALANAYALILVGEDLDGRTGRPKGTGPSHEVKELAKELWDLLKPVRGDKRDWNEANQWLYRMDILDGAVPERAPELSVVKLREVINAAKGKL